MGVLYEVLYDLASCTALWMAWACVSLRFSVPCLAPALAADAAVCLALAARVARRRGRCSVPVKGVLLSRRVTPSWETQTWRYLWDGTSLAVTDVASTFMFLPGFREGDAAILWVDPSRPLRALPPSWGRRVLVYRLMAALCLSLAALTAATCAGWVTW